MGTPRTTSCPFRSVRRSSGGAASAIGAACLLRHIEPWHWLRSDSVSETSNQARVTHAAQQQQRERRLERAHHRAAMRAAHRRARRHARLVAIKRHRAQEKRKAIEAVRAEETTASECDPNYSGACLNPNSYDYDCAGGSGNGPDYTGTVTVTGEDHYGLDADGDGTGCELG